MVLAYWGQSFTEADLATLLGTRAYGTPISNIQRLESHGYQVAFGSLTRGQLQAHLLAERPVIARVWTAMLDYWQAEISSHVVVVVGFDETHVYLNDPAYPDAPQSSVWDGFLAAWAEFDETAGVVFP
jgi:predicted double-glycine peptidase